MMKIDYLRTKIVLFHFGVNYSKNQMYWVGFISVKIPLGQQIMMDSSSRDTTTSEFDEKQKG